MLETGLRGVTHYRAEGQTNLNALGVDRLVPLQPLRGTSHAPVVKDIDNRTALQVDDRRAVAPVSPPIPVIYANDPDRGVATRERGIPLQLPQDRVVADSHAEPSHQVLARKNAEPWSGSGNTHLSSAVEPDTQDFLPLGRRPFRFPLRARP
ncbi:hypothetical protein ABIE33_006075 [Ensifer sp. 4252]